MTIPIILLLAQGSLGAFDTLWYHEYKLRLPHRHAARRELQLHSARDVAYAFIFLSLAWCIWCGVFAWAFLGVLLFEIIVTLWDFVEEDRTRVLPPGERITHAIMGIIFGAFLFALIPVLRHWAQLPVGITIVYQGVISWALSLFAFGVVVSGARDFIASVHV